jgi:hypothetical protein
MIVLNQTLDINHMPAHLFTIDGTHSRTAGGSTDFSTDVMA